MIIHVPHLEQEPLALDLRQLAAPRVVEQQQRLHLLQPSVGLRAVLAVPLVQMELLAELVGPVVLEVVELVAVLEAGMRVFDHTGCKVVVHTVVVAHTVADHMVAGRMDTVDRKEIVDHMEAVDRSHRVVAVRRVAVRRAAVRRVVDRKVLSVHMGAVDMVVSVAEQLVSFLPLFLLSLPSLLFLPPFLLLFLHLALLGAKEEEEVVQAAVASVDLRTAEAEVDKVEDRRMAVVGRVERKDQWSSVVDRMAVRLVQTFGLAGHIQAVDRTGLVVHKAVAHMVAVHKAVVHKVVVRKVVVHKVVVHKVVVHKVVVHKVVVHKAVVHMAVAHKEAVVHMADVRKVVVQIAVVQKAVGQTG